MLQQNAAIKDLHPWLCPTFYKWAKEAAQRSQIKPIQKFDAFLTLPFQFWVVFILVLNIRLSILPPAQPPPLLFFLIFFLLPNWISYFNESIAFIQRGQDPVSFDVSKILFHLMWVARGMWLNYPRAADNQTSAEPTQPFALGNEMD